MAKYGSFKYGTQKYGRAESVGSAFVFSSGNLASARAFFKNVGQGAISGISSSISITMNFARSVGNGLLASSNSIQRLISKSLQGSIISVGMLSRQGTFKRVISGAVTTSGKLIKNTGKKIYGSMVIHGLISKLLNKMVGKGNIQGLGVLSKMQSFYIVTIDGILIPLGVKVLGDTREELIAGTRDNTDEVPGRHGEYDFGTELRGRTLELKCATLNGLAPKEKKETRRKIAEHLNPMKGYRILIFEDDPDIEYKVKYSGKIDIKNYSTFFDFTIPFKMNDPFSYAREESALVGSGTIANLGSIETGLMIEITGPATNPSLTIGGATLAYTGTIAAGQKLTIDTLFKTAKIGSTNALSGYNGVFPVPQTGNTQVVAGNNVTIRWKNRYL